MKKTSKVEVDCATGMIKIRHKGKSIKIKESLSNIEELSDYWIGFCVKEEGFDLNIWEKENVFRASIYRVKSKETLTRNWVTPILKLKNVNLLR